MGNLINLLKRLLGLNSIAAAYTPPPEALISSIPASILPKQTQPSGPQATNNDGLAIIKEFEGCKLNSYQDVRGIWTIGYGHTGKDVSEGLSINQDQADELLRGDLRSTEKYVTNLIKVPLTSNQFSALICFTYNVGSGNLSKSSLLTDLNSSNYSSAADKFLLYDKSGGVVYPGLLRRRQAERALFLKIS